MDLGTAKPTPEERARVPHHLIDVADPDQPFTAGDYSRRARAALQRDRRRGQSAHRHRRNRPLSPRSDRRPLRRPSAPGRSARSPARAAPNATAAHGCIACSSRLDPASAARIHANDTPKLIRAIEVCLAARKPMSQCSRLIARDPLTGFRLLRIGLNPPRAAALRPPQSALRRNVCRRPASQETRALLACYGPVKALDSLGYRQACRVLHQGRQREGSHRRSPAGPSQLRQAPAHLVSPRARRALDRSLRRRRRNAAHRN